MKVETIRERARRFLVETFERYPNGIYRADLMRLADEEGISSRTLSRVAAEVGVTRIRQGRAGDIWRWSVEGQA